MALKWKPLARDYDEEIKNTSLTRTNSKDSHPLLGGAIQPTKAKKATDPLSSLASKQPATDPLSSLLANGSDNDPLRSSSPTATKKTSTTQKTTTTTNVPQPKPLEVPNDGFVPWKAKKAGILATYTTDEAVGIEASFLNDIQGTTKVQNVDKQHQRLDALDESEEKMQREDLKIRQNEYIKHMEKLNEQLGTAWDNEERVKSLKIAIQCAKVLSDVSVIKFYPSKWVLITEILDTFGELVYRRIWNRSIVEDPITKTSSYLPDDFTPKDVPDIARETCRNWFFKIASIRELLPRLYVEMAIIRCYSYLSQNSYREVINRLCMMTRGIGDPLVASYARAYLARKGREVAPTLKEYLLTQFDDNLYTHQYVMSNDHFMSGIKTQIDTVPNYLFLYSPAIEWLLQCIAHNADKETFTKVLTAYGGSGGETAAGGSGLVLHHILASFNPEYISEQAKGFAELIKEAEADSFAKYKLYATFGVTLGLSHKTGKDARGLLNDVWKVVTKFKDPTEYMTVAEVWIDYPIKHCSHRETNILLGDIIKHVKVDKAYEKLQLQLQSVVQKIVASYHDFTEIFGMNNFLPLLDLFIGETQVEVNKTILEAFCKYQNVTRDPVIINSMFTVGKIVHDSENSLTFQDEVKQISRLIGTYIYKIDFGREVEKHLNFYVDCRRAFANLDLVKAHLVIGVCNLAVKTLKLIGGGHTKKTASFVRACVAFCFITIPSLDDVFTKLNLYLLAGHVAFMNQCLPQADSLFKAAITNLLEVPPFIEIDKQTKSTEDQFVSFINVLLSSLVVVPGHPEFGPFYLIKGLIKVVEEYKWESGSTAKIQIYTNLLAVFSAQAQTKLVYHIDSCESNDVLYGGDAAFGKELDTLVNKVATLAWEGLQALTAQKQQRALALALFNQTIALSELTAESATLAGKLFIMAKDAGAEKSELLTAIKAAKYKSERSKLNAGLYEKLQSLV